MARGEIALRGAAWQIQQQPDRLRSAYLRAESPDLSADSGLGPPAADNGSSRS